MSRNFDSATLHLSGKHLMVRRSAMLCIADKSRGLRPIKK